jgi:hypothetical protein
MWTCDAVTGRPEVAPFRYGAERNLLPRPSFSWRQTSTESGEEVSACS